MEINWAKELIHFFITELIPMAVKIVKWKQTKKLKNPTNQQELKSDFDNSFKEFLEKAEKFGINFDFNNESLKKSRFEHDFNIDDLNIQKDFWDNNKDVRSILIDGPQGSGKTLFAKKLHAVLQEQDAKIMWIKTWDYDYDNVPIILFLKKLLNLNILSDIDNKKLQILIWLYKNKDSLAPSHIIIDIVKDFIYQAELKQELENQEIVFFIDELERCKPDFAHELLEVMTTYTGVEASIDPHTRNWNKDNKHLLLNKLKVVWVFDKNVIHNSICNQFGQKNDDKKFYEGFWRKYIEKEIKVSKLKIKNILDIFKNAGIKSPIYSMYNISSGGYRTRYSKLFEREIEIVDGNIRTWKMITKELKQVLLGEEIKVEHIFNFLDKLILKTTLVSIPENTLGKDWLDEIGIDDDFYKKFDSDNLQDCIDAWRFIKAFETRHNIDMYIINIK